MSGRDTISDEKTMTRDKSKMTLKSETRWHRRYALEEPNSFYQESKFADATAYITLDELAREWPTWSCSERIDFCQEVGRAKFDHLSDVLRFVMANGDHRTWSAIALDVLYVLPRDESVPFLIAACRNCQIQHCTSLLQALSKSGAPEAHQLIRERLNHIWNNPDLWRYDDKMNLLAADVASLIKYLIALGENSPDLADKYRQLSSHPNEWNRDFAKTWLSKHFEVQAPTAP